MRSSDLFFEKEVNDLLSAFKKSCLTPFQSPPIPVKQICEQYLGLTIKEREIPKREAVGMLIDGNKSISIQRGNLPPYRGFTLAHEIGHWLLHSKNGEELGKGYRRNLISISAKKSKTRETLQEIEANRFAASLLMPIEFVNQYANRLFLLNREAIANLSEIFRVSKIAMLFRIKNIYKYSKWEGPPIDWEDLQAMEREWITKYDSSELKQTLSTLFLDEFDNLIEDEKVSNYEYKTINSLSLNSIFAKIFPLSTDLIYYRRPTMGKKKLMIEFTGLPNAGKNTQIDFLVNDLRSIGYKVARIEEGFESASSTNNLIGKGQENKLMWSMGKLVQDIFSLGLNDEYEIVIINRGPFDFLALTEWWERKGVFDSLQASANKDWILQHLKEWVDVVIYLDVSPEESIRREVEERRKVLDHLARKYHNTGEFPEQQIVNSKALEEMQGAYETTVTTFKNDFKIHRISSGSIIETADAVFSSLQNQITRKVIPKPDTPIQPVLPGFESRPIVMNEDSR